MPELLHQTVRLARGRHRSPEHGVCVMELASLLSGDRFTDQPRAVCPEIAAFLHGYNDHVGRRRRQELLPFAALAVGTRSDEGLEDRAAACAAFAEEIHRRHPLRLLMPPKVTWEDRALTCETAGAYAGRAAHRCRDCHAATLAFVRELIASAKVAADGPHTTALSAPHVDGPVVRRLSSVV